jgi:OOP family OmpA-OmpF porin
MTMRLASLLSTLVLIGIALPAAAQQQGQCTRSPLADQYPNATVLQFDTGKTAIRPDEAKKIAEVAKLAKANFIQQVCVQGFADKQGNAAANQKLSLARAKAVGAELRKNGVDPKTIIIEAKGEPGGGIASGVNLASTADRRVEVRFMR